MNKNDNISKHVPFKSKLTNRTKLSESKNFSHPYSNTNNDNYNDNSSSASLSTKKPRTARILLRPEWRLHLAHLGSIYYQSALVDHLYLLVDDRSPHLSSQMIEFFIEDLEWLGLPNISIVRISDYYDLLFHCAYWFIDHGETHIEKVITDNYIDSPPSRSTGGLEGVTFQGGLAEGGPAEGGPAEGGPAETEKVLIQNEDNVMDGSDENIPALNHHHTTHTRRPHTGTKKYYLRESEIHKIKTYFNLNNIAKPGFAVSLNKLTSHSKLRIRTNANYGQVSTVLMNYYLAESICDLNLSFCLPVIDCFLNVTLILEQGSGNNHAVIGEDTHSFNRRVFSLLDKPYPIYERHSSYKLQNYRYHSDTLTKLVESDILQGFDDPRLLTVRNIRNRGFPKGILHEFATTGAQRGSIDPQQLPDISKSYFLNKTLPKYNGIIEPVRVILTNFPSKLTRYYSSHFCREILALRKLFWIDRVEVEELTRRDDDQYDHYHKTRKQFHRHHHPQHHPQHHHQHSHHPQHTHAQHTHQQQSSSSSSFMLKGTNTYVQLLERVPMNEEGHNIWKQDHTNTYWKGHIFTRPEGLPFPPSLPWLSCDPVERPFKVSFHFYPEFYTGQTLPKPIKVLDGLLNKRPKESGVVVIQGYGFFHYDGEKDLHLMYAFPKSKNCFYT